MFKQDITDKEIEADVMYRLLRKHCWGAKYLPVNTLVNWISKKLKKNGKRVKECIEDLIREGYVISHKRGETISLNPARSREISEYIKRVLKI